MAAKRLQMRKLREILRLHFESNLSNRAISRSCRISPNTAADYIRRAKVAELKWPLPAEVDDAALTRLLYPNEKAGHRRCPEPDHALIHIELKRKHITKQLLWEEYRDQHPDGYQYSQFCARHRQWKDTLTVTMRQTHKAGEKVFVDFSGDGIDIVDPLTGECKTAKLFVAVLGASNLTYIEPVLSEDLPTWIACHVNAFEYFGGVSEIVVPDNLKSGVTRPDYYDPVINPTYADLASHYGIAVIPAVKRKPRHKAKAEQGVLLAERWVLGVLRNQDFTSLSELCRAVKPLTERINNKPMQKIGKSRREVFNDVEKATLRPLPAQPYELCEWKKASVNIDYHIEFDSHYYSVHYTQYTSGRRRVDVRATSSTVEIFWSGKRIASHVRNRKKWDHTTLTEHMPESHRRNIDWPPSRIVSWAKQVGPCTAQVIAEIMARKQHPEQGYRSCLGILRLRDEYSDERIEMACERAVKFQSFSRRSIRATLKNNRDKLTDEAEPSQQSLPLHGNIRGADYYH